MRFLRALILTAPFVGLGATFASSQSLAEVAKKENERRANNDAESTRVVTQRELASFSAPPTSSSVQTQSSGEAAAVESEAQGGETVQDETKTRVYWQNRVKAAKERIAKAEERLQSDDWGDGLRVGINPQGIVNLINRQEEEQQLADARAELEAIRAEARRAGVPLGWVR